MHRLSERATDEVLEQSYGIIAKRFTELLAACGDLTARYNSSVSGKELRAPKGHENDGHAFMRPVVQVAVVRAVRHVVQQSLLTWDEALAKLEWLDWKISSPPFSAVWLLTPEARSQGKMMTGKDNTSLLFDLLVAHLAPTSKAQIDRALRSYRQLRGARYPIPAEELINGIVTAPAVTSVDVPGTPDPVAMDEPDDPDDDITDDGGMAQGYPSPPIT